MQIQQPPPQPQPAAMPMPGHGPMRWPSFGAVAPIALPVPVGIPVPASSTVHTHIPLLREQLDRNMENMAATSEATVKEAVVYGNWKPDRPLKPNNEDGQPKERVYGRLEAILMGMPADVIESREPSGEQLSPETEKYAASDGYQNPYERRDSFERSQEIRGRWRIPPSQLPPQAQAPIEVVYMNATDPLMRAMAKQINESVETTTAMQRRPSQPTTEDSWMPLPYPYPTHSSESTQPVLKVSSTQAPTLRSSQSTESTTVALNWPTDFLETSSISTERIYTDAVSSSGIDRIDNNHPSIDRIDVDVDDDYRYFDEGLNSAQMHSGLSIPETILPQLPLNITRVGIPYEERNSAEEPTICVPLTVTETAADSATPLMVEVERVYCFPLPKVEIKMGNIRRQQEQQHQSTEQEHSNSAGAGVTSLPPEETQLPAMTAGANRHSVLVLLLIIGSSVIASS
ncbi:uncharacterized protein LOC6561037 [Drosophila grimshawi]|uniref:GH20703 n=1 Tax=Drosophila grimshawi TaxID=7222 RepID=B4J714_DROGR|nr:uncharacterized protein LOC6561037 [Drosophila grimshawi]EDW01002.1 GH20703 [Drosophila grimshawi]